MNHSISGDASLKAFFLNCVKLNDNSCNLATTCSLATGALKITSF